MNPQEVLQHISDFVVDHAKKAKVAVVFDLDSTLFCVGPRTQMILRELGADPEFERAHASEAAVLREIEILPSDWGIREALIRAKLSSTLDFFEKVRLHWRSKFFSSSHLHHDELYPSAKEFVCHLNSLGAEVLYLTGRSEGAMHEGTRRELVRHGFPLLSDAHLLMKPSDVMADEGFKATVLKQIVKDYDHVWFFENEPLIIHLVRDQVPQVRIVFIDSIHAGRAEKPLGLPTLRPDYRFGSKPSD